MSTCGVTSYGIIYCVLRDNLLGICSCGITYYGVFHYGVTSRGIILTIPLATLRAGSPLPEAAHIQPTHPVFPLPGSHFALLLFSHWKHHLVIHRTHETLGGETDALSLTSDQPADNTYMYKSLLTWSMPHRQNPPPSSMSS